jgi:hypothetical protein
MKATQRAGKHHIVFRTAWLLDPRPLCFSSILPTRHPPSPRLLFEHIIKTWHAAASGKPPKRTSLAPDEGLLKQRSRIGAVQAIRLTTEHDATTQKVKVLPSSPSARRTSHEGHGRRQRQQGSEVFRAKMKDMEGYGFCGVRCSTAGYTSYQMQ